MGNDTPAFILALLTAGGGITGYIRTGSIPSIAAGCTVGALVHLPSLPFHHIHHITLTNPHPSPQTVRPRRLPSPKTSTVRYRTRAAGVSGVGGEFYPQSDSVGETVACGVECAGAVRAGAVWECVEGGGGEVRDGGMEEGGGGRVDGIKVGAGMRTL
ncbi:hypothetical protein MMC14_002620 [Varicellaria rhodocarpa]|nr:hypothetical protein [Varicellaria rhodocarpa]